MAAVFASTLIVALSGSQTKAVDIIWPGAAFSGFNAAEINVINEAINQWEHLIVDNNTSNNRFSMQIFNVSLSNDILGRASQFGENPQTLSPIFVNIEINQDFNWFVDPTPEDNSEFVATSDPAYFFPTVGLPASGDYDLLTVVLHEIGHGIGFADFYDDWAHLNHLSMGLHVTSDKSHSDVSFHPQDFMSSGGLSTSERRLISDLDLTALARAFDYKLTPDIDRDYDVDTADLTKMLQNFTGDVGAVGNLTHKSGDLDADGDVDTADLTFALQHFTGTMNSSLASQLADLQADQLATSAGNASEGTGENIELTAIPEPSSFALLALGLIGLITVCRRPKIVGQ